MECVNEEHLNIAYRKMLSFTVVKDQIVLFLMKTLYLAVHEVYSSIHLLI
jgi:hypothetical protein